MSLTRREILSNAALAGGAILVAKSTAALAQTPATGPTENEFKSKDDNRARDNVPGTGSGLAPGEPGRDYTPVIIPNGWALPFTIIEA